MEDYSLFEERLGYVFEDKSLLRTAFTHTTYVFENSGHHYDSNQRLEYIGDAVLDLVVGRRLYDMRPTADEGYLSKMRSISVCEHSFAYVARRLGIGDHLLMGKGEDASGGRDKDSTLADAFEAVIAAVYFDGGFDKAQEVILRNLEDVIEDAVAGKLFSDYKSRLLEIAQIKGHQHKIRFEDVDETGPSHMKSFTVAVYADDVFLAEAEGNSKKNAEQKCAKAAISQYQSLFGDE